MSMTGEKQFYDTYYNICERFYVASFKKDRELELKSRKNIVSAA